MLPPESAFCSNHDRKRTFLGCVHAYFAKAFWNADSKRRSKTPFTEVLFMLPSRRRRYVYRRRHVSEFSECLIQAIVRAQVNRKGVYMTSFKRGYNVILRSCFHQNQRFALTTFVNAHFWAFWIGVLKRVYSKISMDATAFCSNHVWKRWFWLQKLSINAPLVCMDPRGDYMSKKNKPHFGQIRPLHHNQPMNFSAHPRSIVTQWEKNSVKETFTHLYKQFVFQCSPWDSFHFLSVILITTHALCNEQADIVPFTVQVCR